MQVTDHRDKPICIADGDITSVTIATGYADPWFIDWWFIVKCGETEYILPIEPDNDNMEKILAFVEEKGVNSKELVSLAGEITPATTVWWRRSIH